ncbi:hypothetical protein CesoFtcFv8_020402 [Champsocephalus esox]|uniref:Uncharacterized protein n=1 Tax=Champsocephalus esox TaxID=159716 RepID=A0AAN8BFP6_9TELE|nr:hypothetical protein CesoFtcFv8_020402 [Champsocephalus esox]
MFASRLQFVELHVEFLTSSETQRAAFCIRRTSERKLGVKRFWKKKQSVLVDRKWRSQSRSTRETCPSEVLLRPF